jgi:hypothetical protein
MVENSQYWAELAQHPEGYVLFYSPQKQMQSKHPSWVALKLMCPVIPGIRIKGGRRKWLSWNRDKHQLAHCGVAHQLPEIYNWVWDTMEQIAERELEKLDGRCV